MDMNARYQYLKVLQEQYFQAQSRKEKSSILDEYCRNTGQNRKYVLRRINSPIHSKPEKRGRREIYDGYVRAALAEVWEIFDYPCGQRLKPLLESEVDRLRELGELSISDEVAEKLKLVSPRTIDRKLQHQKEVLHQNRKYHTKNNPLIYQKIPVRANDWDRCLIGQEEIDLVEHCGSSASGEFINSLSVVDIATGWWEGEAVMGRGQERTFRALTRIRERTPFNWLEIHPDNETAFINDHLLRYAQGEGIIFSRSRPYRKNDNSFVEQKNSTHIRSFLGHLRYDTAEELALINELYENELRLYKNFFQPVTKLREKIREGGKVYRKYDVPRTPYQMLMESEQIPEEAKRELQNLYLSLNPAELKREMDEKLNELFKAYEGKRGRSEPRPPKKQTPRTGAKSYIFNDLTTPISVT